MIKRILIVALVLLGMSRLTDAQIIRTRLDGVAGLGYPECTHLGARYQYNDVAQLGFYYGSNMSLSNTPVETWNLDHMYHFGKHSYQSNRPVWYARAGYTYSIHTQVDGARYFSYGELTAGRDVQLNNHFGFNLDLGLLCQFRERRTFTDPHLDNLYDIALYWKPTCRIQLYYSF